MKERWKGKYNTEKNRQQKICIAEKTQQIYHTNLIAEGEHTKYLQRFVQPKIKKEQTTKINQKTKENKKRLNNKNNIYT